MSDDIKKKLHYAILKHLQDELSTTDEDTQETIGVAADCLQTAFQLNESAGELALPAGATLLSVFCMGLANFQQIATALESTKQQESDDDQPFADAAREQAFQKYLAILSKQKYFVGCDPGDTEHVRRTRKARAKFAARKPTPSANAQVPATPTAAATATTTATTSATTTADTAAAAVAEPSAEDKAAAAQFKAEGNKLLQKEEFGAAIAQYDKAIALDPTSAIFFSNKAAALLHLQRVDEALTACETAVKNDPKYAKAWARLGHARLLKQQLPEALKAYETADQLTPGNQSYLEAIESLKTKIEKQSSNETAAATSNPLAGLGGLGGLEGMMKNPAVANMMESLSQDPDALSNIMNNPMVQQMAQNPDMMANMMKMMGGAGGAPQ